MVESKCRVMSFEIQGGAIATWKEESDVVTSPSPFEIAELFSRLNVSLRPASERASPPPSSSGGIALR